MKNKVLLITIAMALLILMMPGTAMGNDDNPSYAFEIQSQTGQTMSVQFQGNQMYHDGIYMGYGISGKPMLTLRYIAEWFGFRVDYNVQNRSALVSKGEYAFQIEPGSNVVVIYWDGIKIQEYELTEKPFIANSRFHLYSLDISSLLGLIDYWDNNTRTWNVLSMEYTYQESGFPTVVNDDELTIKGLLSGSGQYELPSLEIMDIVTNVRSYTASSHSIDYSPNTVHKYELSSSIRLQEKNHSLRVSLTIGQRILFLKDIDVVVNLENKELVVKQPLYQFTSPTKGYIKFNTPEIIINGSVTDPNNDYPAELVLIVQKTDHTEILEKRIPIIDGQFTSKLALENGEGLYKVTVNSIMAAPRGPAYMEITNFYVEYAKDSSIHFKGAN